MNSVVISGVRIDSIRKESLLNTVLQWAKEPNRRTITYVNAHCLNLAWKDRLYKDILNRTDINYVDGAGVVWAGRFLGMQRLEKVTGREWLVDFCQMTVPTGIRIYILAGKPGVACKAGINLIKQFPSLLIVGSSDGYFYEKKEDAVIQEMNAQQAQVVFVGMGAGLQEKWIDRHREQITAPVCWAVGGLFDYWAGVLKPVPAWMDRLALEWLWILLNDPVNKWRRYILGNPIFITRILREKYSTRRKDY